MTTRPSSPSDPPARDRVLVRADLGIRAVYSLTMAATVPVAILFAARLPAVLSEASRFSAALERTSAALERNTSDASEARGTAARLEAEVREVHGVVVELRDRAPCKVAR